MLKKNVKISIIFNLIIFVLVLLGVVFTLLDFKFMGEGILLERSSIIEPFKYFTVESNIFMGIISLIFLIYVVKDNNKIPKILYILKHAATVGVALTFFTTVLYLAPFSGYDFFVFFTNSNLFFHLIVPILSMITYIVFEKSNNKYNVVIIGMIPMFIYSIFYIINYLLNNHLDDRMKYDWYGFIGDGGINAVISIFMMFFVTYIISYLLFKFNKKSSS